GNDPIARNVAARAWNLAGATTERSGLDLIDSADVAPKGTKAVLVLTSDRPAKRNRTSTVLMDDLETLPRRLRAAIESSRLDPPVVRISLPANSGAGFTVSDAQTLAVLLLDALCSAFAE
ncbi:MAG: peptidoglycan-binding protein, partial [Coriobacteriaceae bacterium]|nr:peptidoglycan-binding protein [Coriobacteriaceae bacterium]